jgi:hypothetical protein
MAEQLSRHSSPEVIPHLLIVDQDRDGDSEWLLSLPRVDRAVVYPEVSEEFELYGHDHPSSLNRACREPIQTTHVIVMDSDCFPMNPRWLDELSASLDKSDCVLAGNGVPGVTLPCFMVMPIEALQSIDFSEGSRLGMDTGRLVGLQLLKAGFSITILDPERTFSGRRGVTYLNNCIIHVGSASFASSTDSRLLGQANPGLDKIVRKRIVQDLYFFSKLDLLQMDLYRLLRLCRRIIGRPRRRR